MEEVNERTTPVLTFSFTDEDGDAVTPSAAYYAIDDVGSGTEILAETEITGLDTSVDITLTQAQTRILTETNPYESRRVTVTFEYGASKHGNLEEVVRIKNLHGVTTPS